MERIEIPLWLISMVGTGVIGWLVYLTTQSFKNQKDIEINAANDRAVASELVKINSAIEKLGLRLDAFLSNEMTLLKEMLKR